jgi:DNA-binding response OmpR family regulator
MSDTPPARILIVDDDDAIAAALKRRLKSEGYDVEAVPTGEEGLKAALDRTGAQGGTGSHI